MSMFHESLDVLERYEEILFPEYLEPGLPVAQAEGDGISDVPLILEEDTVDLHHWSSVRWWPAPHSEE